MNDRIQGQGGTPHSVSKLCEFDQPPPVATNADDMSIRHNKASTTKAFRRLTLNFAPRTTTALSIGRSSIAMSCDADMMRFIKKAGGGSDLPHKRPEIATYLRRAIASRLPLILTGNKNLARLIRKANCPAIFLSISNRTSRFIESIAAASYYFDGTYFLMSGQEPFGWDTYELCRDMAAARRFSEQPFVGLSYIRLPITTVSVAAALSKAVAPQYTRYGDTAGDAINFIKTFLPELAVIPNLESSLAKLASTAAPKFSKQIESEILPCAGLNRRLFRKYREHARLSQEVRLALCA
ncbi:MAG: hypothetical protein QOI07_3243 [Verrucomicrobiota bacterium]|jgi:hypothetical protein